MRESGYNKPEFGALHFYPRGLAGLVALPAAEGALPVEETEQQKDTQERQEHGVPPNPVELLHLVEEGNDVIQNCRRQSSYVS